MLVRVARWISHPATIAIISALTPEDVTGDWQRLDQTIIRLKFRYREPIKIVSGQGSDRYSTRLGFMDDRVNVLFNEDGERVLRRVPESRIAARERDRTVFGLVEAETRAIRLLGIRRTPRAGGEGHDYTW